MGMPLRLGSMCETQGAIGRYTVMLIGIANRQAIAGGITAVVWGNHLDNLVALTLCVSKYAYR